MFSRITVILISSVCILQVQSSKNYCDKTLCSSEKLQHIGCKNGGHFTAGCNGRLIDLKPHIELILNTHNKLRNLTASGALTGFPSAVQMSTMSWDNELAYLAALNVFQCKMKHDKCRNTRRYRYSGQNLGIMGTTAAEINIKTFIEDRLQKWFNEYKMATRNDVALYSGETGKKGVGHFTVMVNEQNDHVGCALARYTEGRWQYALLACNYAANNMFFEPVYKFGLPTTECRYGANKIYKSLCALDGANI